MRGLMHLIRVLRLEEKERMLRTKGQLCSERKVEAFFMERDRFGLRHAGTPFVFNLITFLRNTKINVAMRSDENATIANATGRMRENMLGRQYKSGPNPWSWSTLWVYRTALLHYRNPIHDWSSEWNEYKQLHVQAYLRRPGPVCFPRSGTIA